MLVFVSAAVDGVCLQTSESIGCAEELGLPAVVVLNKIDLLPDEVAAQVSIFPLSSKSRNCVLTESLFITHEHQRRGVCLRRSLHNASCVSKFVSSA